MFNNLLGLFDEERPARLLERRLLFNPEELSAGEFENNVLGGLDRVPVLVRVLIGELDAYAPGLRRVARDIRAIFGDLDVNRRIGVSGENAADRDFIHLPSLPRRLPEPCPVERR